jgi:hypothetical protein
LDSSSITTIFGRARKRSKELVGDLDLWLTSLKTFSPLVVQGLGIRERLQGRGRGWPSKCSRARARYFNRGRGERGDPCIARPAERRNGA